MNHEMIKYLANLGKLNLSEEQLNEMAKDMTSIIEIMDTVKEIDISYQPILDNHNVYLNDLRKDVPMDSFSTEKILQNALSSENAFVVPKVFD